MAWESGDPWRVVGSLNKLNEQIRAAYPRAIPPATDVNSWGAIADNVHSQSSDHYPHHYSALGSTAVVCARDFPHAPSLGINGGTITEHMRQARDSRVGYIIFNRRITGPNHGWTWDTYTGSDPHDTHFHVSSVHGSAADNTAAWSLPSTLVQTPTLKGNSNMILAQVTGGDGKVWLSGASRLWVQTPQLRDKLLASLGQASVAQFTQAEFDAVMASQEVNATTTFDAAALAAALAPLLGNDEAELLSVLQSPEGQTALSTATTQGVKNL